jgi:sugar/nucleoside kinase (ribokinase family)
MSVLIVGSIALDDVKTPVEERFDLLGGSASYASVAAGYFSPVNLVAIVGEDFPADHWNFLQSRGINLEGVQRAPGKTFRWSGEYMWDMNTRETRSVALNVFETFSPKLPAHFQSSDYVLLANIAPDLQLQVLDQMEKPKFVIADTMDLWMNIALPDLLRLLKRVDCLVLNDGEARQLVKEDNVPAALAKIHKLGPRYVIIKKGEHGSLLSGPKGLFVAPAYPLNKVVDPTGAGDSFVGGLIGYLAAQKGGSVDAHLRRAIVHGAVVASFCCEGFGLARTTKATKAEIAGRVRELEKLVKF